jgi:hypothetical protein
MVQSRRLSLYVTGVQFLPTSLGDGVKSLPPYDKEKYKEMILDAAETVLGFFGFDMSAYSNFKKGRRKWLWYEELREQRTRDIETEMI